MADARDRDRTMMQVVVAILAGLCIVGLLAWARGEPGIDGRAPDPEDVTLVVQVPTEAG